MSDSAVVNIASALSRSAARFPDKPAVVVAQPGGGYVQMTFRELEDAANRLAAGLEQAGVQRGMRSILMVRPGREFFALTFALLRLGAVPVLIDPGMGRRNLAACLAGIDAEAFIGIPLAHVFRLLHSKSFDNVRITVTVGRRWFWRGVTYSALAGPNASDFSAANTTPDETAAILFTSGSTGPAKGVVYTHGIFAAQVDYLQSYYRYGPDEVDLATFPLFALFDAALGMTAVIPEMDASRPGRADPRKLLRAIADHRCTHMFGSPALLKRLAEYGEAGRPALRTLRRVMTAGAPIRPELLERLHRLLPDGAVIHTPYGATEALPVTDIDSRAILSDTRQRSASGGGTCVGRPHAGLVVRIIAITDNPLPSWNDVRELPAGEIGEIVVKGPVVTRAYYGEPAATTAAKIADPSDGRIWHRMGDVGYFDETGRLWMCGRKAHRVVTADGPLFTVPCEAIFNQHPHVSRTALVGVGPAGNQIPVLCVERNGAPGVHSDEQLSAELLRLGEKHPHTRRIRHILYHPGFPVDVRHNAKIRREELAQWAAVRLR